MTAKQHTCFFVNKVSFGGDREAASTFGSDSRGSAVGDREAASIKDLFFKHNSIGINMRFSMY